MDVLATITSKAFQRQYEISAHALREMGLEGITVDDVHKTMIAPVLVEDYPEDVRSHSCLVLGRGNRNRPIHLVIGCLDQPLIRIITAYRPDLKPHKWNTDWTGRRGS